MILLCSETFGSLYFTTSKTIAVSEYCHLICHVLRWDYILTNIAPLISDDTLFMLYYNGLCTVEHVHSV